ncbi:YraN family protein [Lichenihabitans sp. Uapishka_5]|uniref:YraN family protein n=1 Tax=Lichenihabitans sp. Uapishka_5 TaxID=3037302 RepID=UPI0029E81A86|nr:YraN family protein [Lichenihabitans sp. Uapishka_5]MDX7952396.1 YraN family protein [Lichenihabitans sp. Uapishka_5]
MGLGHDPDRRRRTFLAGHRAERIALIWLALQGYRVLARRYAVRGGEIDLVLRRGGCVIFVEVKARPTLVEAATAVTPAQGRRIARAAAVWLARNPWASTLTLRGDILAIAPWRWPRHCKGALPIQAET